jgi:hypothetical protein
VGLPFTIRFISRGNNCYFHIICKLPDNIDLLNIVVNDLAITSAESFNSLAEILSCPVALGTVHFLSGGGAGGFACFH